MGLPYEAERRIAELAVQRAVIATKTVLGSIDKNASLKDDRSPVSLADFAGQALLIAAIHHAFPEDYIVGEENADTLRQDPELGNQVWNLVSNTHLEDEASEALISSPASLAETLDLIDLGGSSCSRLHGRVWMIDPVDGTKRYLEDGQYGVVATLLVDGLEQVAAIGCPHISTEHGARISESAADVHLAGPGLLVSAIRGRGAQTRPLSKGSLASPQPIRLRTETIEASKLIFTENVATTTRTFKDRHRIPASLGTPWLPVDIYSAQLKYVACALGACDVVMRTQYSLAEAGNVWDHAGGMLVLEESGGIVTDMVGKKIVIGAGRQLSDSLGILAAPAGVHPAILKAARAILGEYPEYASLL